MKDWPVFNDQGGAIVQNAGFGTTGRAKVRDRDISSRWIAELQQTIVLIHATPAKRQP
jgi:hypothetical protein